MAQSQKEKNAMPYNVEARKKYNKTYMKKITFDFNVKTEIVLIERIERQENKSGYVKGLIRKDIEENP